MASDLRQELDCSICLNVYTDPVMLRCGHNFCRVCIDRALQEQSRYYSCPQCRKRFSRRPTLQRNITLCNIVEKFCSAKPAQEKSEISCTYCIHSPVPAVKSCLMCEASLCDNHLKVHSKSPEHVLSNLATSMERKQCSIHEKSLEYVCLEDATCVVESCSLVGEHQEHKVETLDEASERKKQKLRNVLQKLISKRAEAEQNIQILQDHKKKVKEKAAVKTEEVTTLFTQLKRQLQEVENKILREIRSQKSQLSHSLSDLIQLLESKKEDLSRKMSDIEKLCNMTDPLTVLQESDTSDLCICDTEEGDNEDTERHDKLLYDGGNLDVDVDGISHTLHTLSEMIKGVNVCFYIQRASDIVLDVNTARNDLHISDDLKTVSWTHLNQKRPVRLERFQYYPQVLGSQGFSSGRHYWDVDVSNSNYWYVGMCYPSIERKGEQSVIGNKSWGLHRKIDRCFVHLGNKRIQYTANNSSNTVRVYLDYEAGQLSFYELCNPIRRLHTFTTTFTEPLHAVLYVKQGCVKICGGSDYRE